MLYPTEWESMEKECIYQDCIFTLAPFWPCVWIASMLTRLTRFSWDDSYTGGTKGYRGHWNDCRGPKRRKKERIFQMGHNFTIYFIALHSFVNRMGLPGGFLTLYPARLSLLFSSLALQDWTRAWICTSRITGQWLVKQRVCKQISDNSASLNLLASNLIHCGCNL